MNTNTNIAHFNFNVCSAPVGGGKVEVVHFCTTWSEAFALCEEWNGFGRRALVGDTGTQAAYLAAAAVANTNRPAKYAHKAYWVETVATEQVCFNDYMLRV